MEKKELEFALKLQKQLEDLQKKMQYHHNKLKELLEELYLKK